MSVPSIVRAAHAPLKFVLFFGFQAGKLDAKHKRPSGGILLQFVKALENGNIVNCEPEDSKWIARHYNSLDAYSDTNTGRIFIIVKTDTSTIYFTWYPKQKKKSFFAGSPSNYERYPLLGQFIR